VLLKTLAKALIVHKGVVSLNTSNFQKSKTKQKLDEIVITYEKTSLELLLSNLLSFNCTTGSQKVFVSVLKVCYSLVHK